MLEVWAERCAGPRWSADDGKPDSSYLWPFYSQRYQAYGKPRAVRFAQCRYGTPWKKPTRLLVWGGLDLDELERPCTKRGDRYSCGALVSQGHEVLGFGGAPTAAAALYPKDLCKAWAKCLVKQANAEVPLDRMLSEVVLSQEGPVRKHE